jgi:uncharacterized heparinase superfamily protein
MKSRTEFQFLNQTHTVEAPRDWNDPTRDKLWLYNLHYFDDLSSVDAAARSQWHADLVNRWMRDNPPPAGAGWESYPTSLRIINWIKWVLAGDPVSQALLDSLAVQVRWLEQRIEWHLLANHLFVNGKALVVAGLFFDGPEAKQWREKGLRIIARELPVQILRDGGQFERSPMYHALALEDILDLINAAQAWPGVLDERMVAHWREVAVRMQGWLYAMSHPDGQISFFNDAAFGIAPEAAALAEYAGRLGIGKTAGAAGLGDSGYVRAEVGSAVLIADTALVGPDYQPGHAHADTLSFEFSLDGQRLFVNSGTSTYQPGAQRQFERSTSAHNTVELNGADSSEVWGAFRVARRARPRNVTMEKLSPGVLIEASHDGYSRLAGRPIHRRSWRLETGRLSITDRISDRFDRAVARFYLHPAIALLSETELRLPNGRVCSLAVAGGTVRVAKTQWYPEFGLSQENSCIEVVMSGRELGVVLSW